MIVDPFPRAYAYWPDWCQCRFRERLAILREANNVPDDQPLPWQMLSCACEQVAREIKEAQATP